MIYDVLDGFGFLATIMKYVSRNLKPHKKVYGPLLKWDSKSRLLEVAAGISK